MTNTEKEKQDESGKLIETTIFPKSFDFLETLLKLFPSNQHRMINKYFAENRFLFMMDEFLLVISSKNNRKQIQ